MSKHEIDEAVERYHVAAREFVKGNPEPQKAAFSHADDVTLVNPAGFVGTGWTDVEKVMERSSAQFTDGEVVGFDRLAQQVTSELAYIVEIERCGPESTAATRSQRLAYGSPRFSGSRRRLEGRTPTRGPAHIASPSA